VAPQVPKDKAAGVADLATAENLNSALASSGIVVAEVRSDPGESAREREREREI